MNHFASNTTQIKYYNVGIVKSALKALPSGTKNTIARITGLSIATCNTILNELAMTGEIIEISSEFAEIGSVGRPAKTYRFNEKYAYIGCLSLGYENKKKTITYSIVDLLGNTLVKDSMVLNRISYHEVEWLIGDLIKKYENIKAVGIGIPGVVNQKHIIDICDIEELVNCPLEEKLTEKFGLDVVIENDMNLIAYGFYYEGNYTEDTPIAVISFFKDNYPGSGIIIDGNIIHGNTNFAGEVSYLPFECSREEQLKRLGKRSSNVEIVAKTIASMAAIINPKTIVLTGESLDENMIEDIFLLCDEVIPQKHMPGILFCKEVNYYYLKGISALTQEKMNNL